MNNYQTEHILTQYFRSVSYTGNIAQDNHKYHGLAKYMWAWGPYAQKLLLNYVARIRPKPAVSAVSV